MVTHFIHLFTHRTCITESHYKIMSTCTDIPVHEHKNSLYSCFSLAVRVRTFSHQFLLLKVLFTEKWKFRHHLLTLSSFQTCITFFRLWNTYFEELTVFVLRMKVSDKTLYGQINNKEIFHFSKYLLCSIEGRKKESHTGLTP